MSKELKLTQTGDRSYELDVIRQICPFPEVYTVKIARNLPAGARLRVFIADHCSLEDMVQALRREGLRVSMSPSQDGVITLDIAAPASP